MTVKCQVYETTPKNFFPSLEVAGCLCEHEKKFLLLKRHPDKPQGNQWGMAAGKLEKGEDPKTGVIREVYEEVGLILQPQEVELLGSLFVKHPDLDFIFHVFHKKYEILPEIILGLEEHLECKWVTPDEMRKLPLIGGGHEIIDYALKKLK